MNILYGHSPSADSRSAVCYRLNDHLVMTISVDQDINHNQNIWQNIHKQGYALISGVR